MVYNLTIINDAGIPKQFYLSGTSESDVIKRARDTYAVPPERIKVIEYHEDTGTVDINPKPIPVGEKKSKKDKKADDKASELYYSAKKKRGSKKSDYIKKYNFTEVKISGPDDISNYIKKYKKVKCYWEPSSERGKHQYYLLVK